jgi:hypothetical protein
MLGTDQAALEFLLGATPNICCMINHPADEEESEHEDGGN